MGRKPKVIVFDLDNTLWPFYADSCITPPFKRDEMGIVDRDGRRVESFGGVTEILQDLHNAGYQLAVASRIIDSTRAFSLLELFGWNQYFQIKEIYLGSKTKHLEEIHKKTNVPMEDILFFDDNPRNTAEVRELGVHTICTPRGVSKLIVDKAFAHFAADENKQ